MLAVTRTSVAFGARMRKVTRWSGATSGEMIGSGRCWACSAEGAAAKANIKAKSRIACFMEGLSAVLMPAAGWK